MKMTEIEQNWLKENLGKIEFLKKFSISQIQELISHATPRVLMGDQPIIREGDDGKAFFLIFHGRVTVWVERNGKEAKLATLSTGDFFGEISLLTGKPATANVMATIPTKVFFLDPDRFLKMVWENKELAKHVTEVMRDRLLARKKEVEELMRSDLGELNQAIIDFLNQKDR